MINIEELEKEIETPNRLTEGEHELKIVDVRYDEHFIYTNKETGKQSSGKKVILTVEVNKGSDSGKKFNLFYNLNDPKWGKVSSAFYLKIIKAVFVERSEQLKNGKDPHNLLHRSFIATIYYKPGSEYINIKDERPIPSTKQTPVDLDDEIPF